MDSLEGGVVLVACELIDVIFQLHVMDSQNLTIADTVKPVLTLSTPCNGFTAEVKQRVEQPAPVALSTPCNGFGWFLCARG